MSHDHKCKKRLYCSPMIAQSRVWLVTLEGNKICRIRASVDIVTNQRCSHSNEACHFMSNLFLNKLDFCRRIIVCHDSKEHPLNFWRATIFYSNNRCVRKFSSIIMWKRPIHKAYISQSAFIPPLHDLIVSGQSEERRQLNCTVNPKNRWIFPKWTT